ncbi:MAG TPA: hypothetical protein VLB73_04005 [Patescibacteria group bacterium]|nr:hypothetical protein [Patescibacteria group bacterium]
MVRALVELPDHLRGRNPDDSPIIPPRVGSRAAQHRANAQLWDDVQPAPKGQRGWGQEEEAAQAGTQTREDAARLGPVDMGEYSEPQAAKPRHRLGNLFRGRKVA